MDKCVISGVISAKWVSLNGLKTMKRQEKINNLRKRALFYSISGNR